MDYPLIPEERWMMNHWTLGLPRFSGTSDGDFDVTSPRDFDKCPNPQGSQLKSDPPLVRVYATSA